MIEPTAHRHEHGSHHGHHHEHGAEGLVTDPVCGMSVDPATSTRRMEHEGRVFHFCSARCQEKFRADPAHYLVPVTQASEPVAA